MNYKGILAFDLDGVLCVRGRDYEHLGPRKYNYSNPVKKYVDIVNDCYDSGYYIKIYTSRGMTQFQGDESAVYAMLYKKTVKWLKENNVKFHELRMGKIHFDLLIDDKCVDSQQINNKDDIEKILSRGVKD